MELTVEYKPLVAALKDVKAVHGSKKPKHGYVSVRLRAEGDELELACTDYYTTVLARVEAKVKEPGVCCLPVAKLLDLLKADPGQEVRISDDPEAASGHAGIKVNHAVWGLATDLQGQERFDKLPEPGETTMEIEGRALAGLRAPVLHAASREETRFNLKSVYLHASREEDAPNLTAVATDGHRLVRNQAEVEGLELKEPVIVPIKAVERLLDMAKRADKMELALGGPVLTATAGKRTLTVRIYDGAYPDYEVVVPTEIKHEVAVSREGLALALKRMKLLGDRNFPGAKLTFSKGKITARCEHPDLGQVSEKIKADYKGKDMTVGLNPKYVLELAKVMRSEDISLGLIDQDHPIMIMGAAEPNLTSVIMPMRL